MKLKLFYLVFVTLMLVGRPAAACSETGGPAGAYHPNGGGWVADTAQVDSTVYVGPGSTVCDNARVSGNAVIRGNSLVADTARVYGNARVVNSTVVNGAQVSGDAVIRGNSLVADTARVYGNARVDSAWVAGEVFGTALVRGGAQIKANGKVNCGRWRGIEVFDDQTGKCGRNGRDRQDRSGSSDSLGDRLSNPINEVNTESE